jgi:dTDP-4-amino-4,6-dideoxygalactose transaminase
MASLPETERAATEILSLPMYPELAASDVQSVIAAVLTTDRDERAPAAPQTR